MKILLIGASGQLGKEIMKMLSSQKINVFAPSKNDLNLFNIDSFSNVIKEFSPDWVVNCAAYTNVEQAETEPEKAYAINTIAPKAIASCVKNFGGKFLHLSTDYVFNGYSKTPYKEIAQRDPLSVYGKSKAAGEMGIEEVLKYQNKAIILRTSWLVGIDKKNFLSKILNLNIKKEEFDVICDQVGSPTSTYSLARLCWKILSIENLDEDKKSSSIFHWSDSGVASWYDFAKAIIDISFEKGLLKKRVKVEPIFTYELNTKAKRPNYSILNTLETKKMFNIKQVYWRDELDSVIKKME